MSKRLASFNKWSFHSAEINFFVLWFLRSCSIFRTLWALCHTLVPLFVDRAKCDTTESALYTWIYCFTGNICQFSIRFVWLSEVELSHSVIFTINTQPNQHLRQQSLCIDQIHLLLANRNPDNKRKINSVIPRQRYYLAYLLDTFKFKSIYVLLPF